MEHLGTFFGFFEKYSWIGSATQFVHLENSLDIHVQKLADGIGMQLAIMKYTLALFLVYPFAIILRKIPNL